MNESEKIKAIDTMVGKRITDRRRLLGLSQQDLANVVGVSVQQIQKYEKSTNRITCGKLYQFAMILKVSISYFFHGIDELLNKKDNKNQNLPENIFAEDQVKFKESGNYMKVEKEIANLVKSYNSISNRQIRKKLSELLKSMSNVI